MELKKYTHKYRKAVTGKFVITYQDLREEMAKTAPTVKISGAFGQDVNLSIAEARELAMALHAILKRLS
jgi:hypothetical protein